MVVKLMVVKLKKRGTKKHNSNKKKINFLLLISIFIIFCAVLLYIAYILIDQSKQENSNKLTKENIISRFFSLFLYKEQNNSETGRLNQIGIMSEPLVIINSPVNNMGYNTQDITFDISNSGGETMMINLDNSFRNWWTMEDYTLSGVGDLCWLNGNWTVINSKVTIKDFFNRNDGTIKYYLCFPKPANRLPAKYNQSVYFNGTMNLNLSSPIIPANSDFTISAWINRKNGQGHSEIISQSTSYSNYSRIDYYYNPTWIFFYRWKVVAEGLAIIFPAGDISKAGIPIPENTWQLITLTRAGNTFSFYLNGNIIYSAESSHAITQANTLMGNNFLGNIDDVTFFNKALSESEIKSLYDARQFSETVHLSDGTHTLTVFSENNLGEITQEGPITFYIDTTPPTVTLLTPNDGGGTLTQTQDFKANFTDAVKLKNATLFIYDSFGNTVANPSTTLSGTIQTVSNTITLPTQGTYTWNYYACDISNNCIWGGPDRTFIYGDETVDLISPNNSFITNNSVQSFISFSKSAVQLKNSTLYVWNSMNTPPIITSSKNILGLTNLTNITSSLPYEDHFKWNVNTCDINNNCVFSGANWTFILDKTAPKINFLPPTPGNNSFINQELNINTSIIEPNKDTVWLVIESSSGTFIENFNSSSGNYYWTKKTGFSDRESIYLTVFANDSAGNQNNTGKLHFTVDSSFPQISFSEFTPLDNSMTNDSKLFVDSVIIEDNLDKVIFTLRNEYEIINQTTFTGSKKSINWTLNTDGIYFFDIEATDLAGNINQTETRKITFDSTPPNVTLLNQGMPINDTIGGGLVLFNWTASDNLDMNITCYPFVDEQIFGEAHFTENGTISSAYEILPGGRHILQIICKDDLNNFKISKDAITYLVAIINISSPGNNSIIRVNDLNDFIVEELDGKDFLNRALISITDSFGIEFLSFFSEDSSDRYVNTKIIPYHKPDYLKIFAVSYNSSKGINLNATDEIRVALLRPIGETVEPLINYACPEDKFIVNGSTIKLNLVADLDTLLNYSDLLLTDPDGIIYQLSPIPSQINKDGVDYIDEFNYSFFINKVGEYQIQAEIKDYEGYIASWSSSFYSIEGYNNYMINSSTVSYLSKINQCSKKDINPGREINVSVTNGELVTIRAGVIGTIYDIITDLNLVSLTENLSEAVTYNDLSNEYKNIINDKSAPEGENRVMFFELSSKLNYQNYDIMINYSIIKSIINNESTLKLYKCNNLSECNLENVSAILSADLNIIQATNLSSLSYFMLTEKGSSIFAPPIDNNDTDGEKNQVIIAGPGGGGGQSISSTQIVKYKNFQLLVPGKVELGKNEELTIPIKLVNKEKIKLKNIKISYVLNSDNITAELDTKLIPELKPGTNQTIFLKLISKNATIGEYDIEIKANIENPGINDSSKIFISLIESVGRKTIMERVVFAQDLFRNNPECMELNDIIILAQKLLEEERFNESTILIQQAIDKCRELVTSKIEVPKQETKVKWKDPMFISIIILIVVVMLFIIIILFIKRSSLLSLNIFKKTNTKKIIPKNREDIWK